MFTQHELRRVVEGMEVYDQDGTLLGAVKDICPGKGAIKTVETDITSMVETVSDMLGGRKDLPTVLYTRLYDEGFIRVDRGLFRRDVILFHNEISDINEISVHLNKKQHTLTSI